VYRWVDHTSEVELEIEAAGEREVFEEAARALAELLGIDPKGAAEATAERRVAARATDRPALLAAWLEELAFLAEAEGFVATRVVELEVEADGLRATVAGVLDEPPPLVKAVTYHRLLFEPRDQRYVARVVLDV
jgi:SHS2 domain-containing protein